MPRHALFVTLGQTRYRVERPWGDLPLAAPGRITDVAYDAEGRVYAQLRTDPYTDPAAPAVVVLAPDGRRIAAWGEEGGRRRPHADRRARWPRLRRGPRRARGDHCRSGCRRLGGLGRRHRPGEPFNAPCDVAFGPDGSIYVADGYGNSLVHRFAADGRPLGRWGHPGAGPGEFTTPHAVWVLPDGRVAVADRENHRVQIFAPEGVYLSEIRDLHTPMDVHGEVAGRLYVTDQVPRLSLFAPDGALLGRCRPVLNGAHGMWRDPAGNILLAEGNPSLGFPLGSEGVRSERHAAARMAMPSMPARASSGVR